MCERCLEDVSNEYARNGGFLVAGGEIRTMVLQLRLQGCKVNRTSDKAVPVPRAD